MLITTAHLLALKELASGEAAGHAVRTLTEDDSQEYIYRGLELQGLVLLEPPRAYRLTYAGREGPLTAEALSARGLTESVHNTLEKRSFVRLNQYGEAWGDFARRYRPRLEIDGDLANSIHYMHPGYTGRPDLHIPDEHIALLEVMNLLSWSAPERTIYTLTALGQAVYEALRKGGYAPLDAVLDEPTLEVLAMLVDRGSEALTSEQMLDLQTLGYVLLDGTVSY